MNRCRVIEYLQLTLKAPEECVVYFYFDQSEKVNQNAELVLKCLIKQLAYQLSGQTQSMPAPLKAAFDRYYFEGCKIRPDIDDFVDIFIKCAELCRRPVCLILDAYNEYEENVTNSLTSRLIKLVESGVVKLYITTRVQLQGIPWPSKPMRLRIESLALDVSRYVRAQIKDKEYDQDLEEEILEAVTQKANGL